jgi:hypothetical protein
MQQVRCRGLVDDREFIGLNDESRLAEEFEVAYLAILKF